MLNYIEKNKMLPTSSETLGVLNFLSHIPAIPKQAHDLLNFRKVDRKNYKLTSTTVFYGILV